MLNDPALAECARGLGLRVIRECPGGLADRIRHAFRISLARAPDEQELEALAQVYASHMTLYGNDPKATVELLGGEPLAARCQPAGGGSLGCRGAGPAEPRRVHHA